MNKRYYWRFIIQWIIFDFMPLYWKMLKSSHRLIPQSFSPLAAILLKNCCRKRFPFLHNYSHKIYQIVHHHHHHHQHLYLKRVWGQWFFHESDSISIIHVRKILCHSKNWIKSKSMGEVLEMPSATTKQLFMT